MLSKVELWQQIEVVVEQSGLALFDIDLPADAGGTLRVYIAPKHLVGGVGTTTQGGISLDDCALVTQALRAADSLDNVLQRYGLEVSSPGVNRRLQRPEHYAGAIGERVRVTAQLPGEKATTYRGQLVGCELAGASPSIELLNEETDEVVVVPLEFVQQAQVDFLFT